MGSLITGCGTAQAMSAFALINLILWIASAALAGKLYMDERKQESQDPQQAVLPATSNAIPMQPLPDASAIAPDVTANTQDVPYIIPPISQATPVPFPEPSIPGETYGEFIPVAPAAFPEPQNYLPPESAHEGPGSVITRYTRASGKDSIVHPDFLDNTGEYSEYGRRVRRRGMDVEAGSEYNHESGRMDRANRSFWTNASSRPTTPDTDSGPGSTDAIYSASSRRSVAGSRSIQYSVSMAEAVYAGSSRVGSVHSGSSVEVSTLPSLKSPTFVTHGSSKSNDPYSYVNLSCKFTSLSRQEN